MKLDFAQAIVTTVVLFYITLAVLLVGGILAACTKLVPSIW